MEETAKKVNNGINLKDVIYIFLIVLSGVVTYFASKGETQSQIIRLQESDKQQVYLIERNLTETKVELIKVSIELKEIKTKLEDLELTLNK